MRQGQKKIFHLEAWVVKAMSLIKVSSLPPVAFPHNLVAIPIALIRLIMLGPVSYTDLTEQSLLLGFEGSEDFE